MQNENTEAVDDRGQRLEVRGQRAGDGGQMLEVRPPKFPCPDSLVSPALPNIPPSETSAFSLSTVRSTATVDRQPLALPNLPAAFSDEEAFDRLAALTPAQYDRVRQAEATSLGIRLETLDAEVAKCRPDVSYDAQARAVKLQPVEPWPEPVDGSEVLTQVTARFTLHIVLPPGAAVELALWEAHVHAFGAFLHTPRLNLSSPEPECGKTTTLDLLATMAPRALRTENITAPVLFRLVDQHQPTLFLDEVDTYLPRAEELRGLLNAGHKQGACAYRCEGDGNAVRAFKAFAPAVLSGIGTLPETLHDRSIRVLLLPADPKQISARFDSRHHEIEDVLCRKLARWAQDNFAALRACDPVMPATAYNRVADNWRPLFAIAEVAGGDWPRLLLEAYTQLNRQRTLPNHQFSTLLANICRIFTRAGTTRISSKQLAEALRALPDHQLLSPPSTINQQAPLTPALLARRLHRFGINPRTMRIGGRCVKGYHLSDFTEALARLSKDNPPPAAPPA